MKWAFTLLSLGLFIGGSAQFFAPIGATWTYYDYIDSPWPDRIGRPYFRIVVTADTTINNRTYSKLQRFAFDGLPIDSSEIFLRLENDTIFFFEDGMDKPSFHYTGQPGDTLLFYIPKNLRFLNPGCCSVQVEGSTGLVVTVIDSITTINLQGVNLRRWYISGPEFLPIPKDTMFTPWGWPGRYITEKLGGYMTLFGIGTTCCVGGFPGYLHCYEDSVVQYYSDTIPCTYPVGIAQITAPVLQMKVYPNPSTRVIHIEAGDKWQLPFQLEVYDHMGQLIDTRQVDPSLNNINLDLRCGIYVIRIYDSESHFWTKKLTILN